MRPSAPVDSSRDLSATEAWFRDTLLRMLSWATRLCDAAFAEHSKEPSSNPLSGSRIRFCALLLREPPRVHSILCERVTGESGVQEFAQGLTQALGFPPSCPVEIGAIEGSNVAKISVFYVHPSQQHIGNVSRAEISSRPIAVEEQRPRQVQALSGGVRASQHRSEGRT